MFQRACLPSGPRRRLFGNRRNQDFHPAVQLTPGFGGVAGARLVAATAIHAHPFAIHTASAKIAGYGPGAVFRQRLELLYAGKAEVHLENRPDGGTHVSVILPLNYGTEQPEKEETL